MRLSLCAIAATCAVSGSAVVLGDEPETRTFRGVVTLHLIPARVMRVNGIVEDPAPGSSYIGDDSILVEIGENLDVTANSTVVDVEYLEYPEPKVIDYEVFGDAYRVEVEYRALEVHVDGDISQYIRQR